jgi:hypothetical protein
MVDHEAKPGRDDPCPCGSGNKYKKCCLAKEEAAEREELAKLEARRAESAAAHRLHLQEARAAMVAGFAAEDDEEDELTIGSNAPVDLVRAGKLDEAEQTATSWRGSRSARRLRSPRHGL